MRNIARISTVGLLGLLVAFGGAYYVGRQIPSLQAPIAIEAASALTDGGSMHVVLRDANDRRYAIGVEGSLKVPSSEFAVYVQPWFSILPVPIYLPKGSREESALLDALDAWSQQTAGVQPGAELLSQIAGTLRSRKL